MAVQTKILKLMDKSLDIEDLVVMPTAIPLIEDDYSKQEAIRLAGTAGTMYPIIDINGCKFNELDIEYMELSESGFLPTIKVIVRDSDGAFSNYNFPKNNCILKLYVNGKNPNLKAVRCDFLITNVVPSNRASYGVKDTLPASGIGFSYTIYGMLYVPLLNDYKIMSYNSSSLDAIYEIARQTKLGFATNEILTNDSMCWLQPNIQYDDMVRNITRHAYKDDESFFDSFVDKYYNINFVNMKEMLSTDEDYSVEFLYNTTSDIEAVGSVIDITEKSSDFNQISSSLILTNSSLFAKTNLYINEYSFISNQGNILMNMPDTKNIYYYDILQSQDNSKKFVNYYVKSFKEQDSVNSISENIINEWLGVDLGNYHNNYMYAETSNKQNFLELEKTQMVISSEGINLGVMRGMRIPIVIFKNEDSKRSIKTINNKNLYRLATMESGGVYLDTDISGYYIVKSMKIVYDKYSEYANRFSTDLVLWKGQWSKNN